MLSRIQKILHVILDTSYTISIGCITSLGFYPKSLSFKYWPFWLCYLIILIKIIVKCIQYKNSYSIEEWKTKFNLANEGKKYYRNLYLKFRDNSQVAIDSMLRYAGAIILHFNEQNKKTDRITVYGLNTSETEFYAVSRYSENAAFEKINAQKTYNRKKGCISIGFEQGECIENKDFPDYGENPEEYIEFTCKKYGYEREEIEQFSMHSRYYAVKRIRRNEKNLGVIVIESLLPNRFSKKEITPVINQLSEDISPLLEDLVRQIENVEIDYKYKEL